MQKLKQNLSKLYPEIQGGKNLYNWKKFIQKYKAASIFESHVNKTVQKETHINMTRRFSLEQGKDKLMKESIYFFNAVETNI